VPQNDNTFFFRSDLNKLLQAFNFYPAGAQNQAQAIFADISNRVGEAFAFEYKPIMPEF
jgi:hypothetical protein